MIRKLGHQSLVYIDDLFLIGPTFIECARSIDPTIDLLQLLGFTIHPKKSVLTPANASEFLEYITNSEQMILTLTIWIKENIKNSGWSHQASFTYLGEMASTFEVVPFGWFYYQLKKKKDRSSEKSKGNFDCQITLSEAANLDLAWWEQNILEFKITN